jgi:hypothetical protein
MLGGKRAVTTEGSLPYAFRLRVTNLARLSASKNV